MEMLVSIAERKEIISFWLLLESFLYICSHKVVKLDINIVAVGIESTLLSVKLMFSYVVVFCCKAKSRNGNSVMSLILRLMTMCGLRMIGCLLMIN